MACRLNDGKVRQHYMLTYLETVARAQGALDAIEPLQCCCSSLSACVGDIAEALQVMVNVKHDMMVGEDMRGLAVAQAVR